MSALAETFDLAEQLARLAEGTAWRAEDPDRKTRRADRLCGPAPGGRAEPEVDEVLERVLDDPDLRPLHWLSGGLRVAAAVGLVDGPLGNGTGFLVAPWLLMTNNHVLPTEDAAASATVRFGYQQQENGDVIGVQEVGADPARFFVTSGEDRLDYTVVAVGPLPRSSDAPGDVLGTIPLVGAIGKILEGEPINIIQHPAGRPKEIAFRNNRLIKLVDDDVLTYSTDTDRGSSGAPVLNDQWELVGLHRFSVEATDAHGRRVDRTGRPVGPDTPATLRVWTANKGSRASAIVRDLTARSYDGERAALAAALLRGGG
ncbi:trypsin-like serine peptidase [Blastococcus deserti]|uniref:Trypsin-like serine peptidase n=1 Tax=Blastococcus deserti TaxID=2259033 RepID=A0ABW4X5H9_9ACTN